MNKLLHTMEWSEVTWLDTPLSVYQVCLSDEARGYATIAASLLVRTLPSYA